MTTGWNITDIRNILSKILAAQGYWKMYKNHYLINKEMLNCDNNKKHNRFSVASCILCLGGVTNK